MKKLRELNIQKILWYFIIFSILGLIIETTYCYITTGQLESRKGLIIGPFCPIYGLGAAVIIAIFDNSNKKAKSLFLEGFIYGTILEYLMSYTLEAIYGMRFWNYSYLVLNLNGRISLIYSLFWGVLSVVLIKLVAPVIDKIVNKLPKNKIITIGIIIFFILDSICTIWATLVYKNRVLNGNKPVEIKNVKQYIEEKCFTNEFMSKTLPNLRLKDENGEEKFIREYL